MASNLELKDRVQVLKGQLQEQCSLAVKSFEPSRQNSEERLGVLLFLDHKAALDQLNSCYDDLFNPNRPSTTPSSRSQQISEQYVRARDLYMSQLERFPSAYGTKKAYEEFLMVAAAGAATLSDFRGNEAYPVWTDLTSTEALKPASSLRASEGSRWDLKYFKEDEHHRHLLENQRAWVTLYAAFFKRSAFALLGGFALIIPMLIMKLNPTTLTVCLTTTLFVIAAALLLALSMKDTEPKDVLGVTAAYAAVLVVFVGTSTTDAGADNREVAIITGSLVGGIFTLAILAWMYLPGLPLPSLAKLVVGKDVVDRQFMIDAGYDA